MIKLNDKKVLDALNEKWSTKACPMCGTNNWIVDSNMVTPVLINESGAVAVGGRCMPLMAFTCKNCGNVLFINVLVHGAIDDDGETQK